MTQNGAIRAKNSIRVVVLPLRKLARMEMTNLLVIRMSSVIALLRDMAQKLRMSDSCD